MGEKHEVKRRQKREEKTGGKTVQVYGGTDVPAHSTGSGSSMGEESKKAGKVKKIVWITAAASCFLAASAAAAYTYMAMQYRDVFFPNTRINGLDASGKSVDQVKQMIDDGMEQYTLVLEERGGVNEQIGGDQIDLHSEYDGSLEQLLSGQEPMQWGLHLLEGSEHTIETMIAYDHEKLTEVVDGLSCMDESKTELPKNAYLSEYQQGVGYEIIPEQGGTRVVKEKVRQGVADAILNLKDKISLDELDAYEKAKVTSQDPGLIAQAEQKNFYTNVTVTYRFGDKTEVLDGDTIHTWILEDEEGNLSLDEEKVEEYVGELAKNYDTAYQPKTLKTAYGDTVTITGGNYGWRINRKAEAAALSEIIRSGKGQEREPVYSQTAASRGETDYGNTYVEINLTAQHLYYYIDGELLVESDFVSGNEARGMGTPAGAFPLTYKQRNATLRGPGYATPVTYWMPFNGGIGMHDANWRGSFGGRIYKTNGSHGCINLPSSAARTIFENISSGVPVLCYHLNGTNQGKTSSPPRTASAAPAAAPAAAPPADPAPAEGESVLESAAEENGNPGAENGENPSPDPGSAPSEETVGSSEEIPAEETGSPVAGPGEPAVQETAPSPVVQVQETEGLPGPDVQPQPEPQPDSPGVPEGPGGEGAGDGSGVVEAPGM